MSDHQEQLEQFDKTQRFLRAESEQFLRDRKWRMVNRRRAEELRARCRLLLAEVTLFIERHS